MKAILTTIVMLAISANASAQTNKLSTTQTALKNLYLATGGPSNYANMARYSDSNNSKYCERISEMQTALTALSAAYKVEKNEVFREMILDIADDGAYLVAICDVKVPLVKEQTPELQLHILEQARLELEGLGVKGVMSLYADRYEYLNAKISSVLIPSLR